MIVEFHRRVGQRLLLVACAGLRLRDLRRDRRALALQFGALVLLQIFARQLAVDPLKLGGRLRLQRLQLGDFRARIGAGDLGIGQLALGRDDRVDSLLAECTGERGVELEQQLAFVAVLAEHAIAHAGDPAARDAELLARLGMRFLRAGELFGGQAEGVAIGESDAGCGGDRDAGRGAFRDVAHRRRLRLRCE